MGLVGSKAGSLNGLASHCWVLFTFQAGPWASWLLELSWSATLKQGQYRRGCHWRRWSRRPFQCQHRHSTSWNHLAIDDRRKEDDPSLTTLYRPNHHWGMHKKYVIHLDFMVTSRLVVVLKHLGPQRLLYRCPSSVGYSTSRYFVRRRLRR